MGRVQMLEMQIIFYICVQSDGVLASTLCVCLFLGCGDRRRLCRQGSKRVHGGVAWCAAETGTPYF